MCSRRWASFRVSACSGSVEGHTPVILCCSGLDAQVCFLITSSERHQSDTDTAAAVCEQRTRETCVREQYRTIYGCHDIVCSMNPRSISRYHVIDMIIICIVLYHEKLTSKALRYGTCYGGSHGFTCHPHVYPQWNERYLRTLLPSHRASPHFGLYLFFCPAEGRRLSWPEWLVTNRRGLPACRC